MFSTSNSVTTSHTEEPGKVRDIMNAYTRQSFQRGRGGEETAEQIKAFPTIRFLKNNYISNHFVWGKEKKKFFMANPTKSMFKKSYKFIM